MSKTAGLKITIAALCASVGGTVMKEGADELVVYIGWAFLGIGFLFAIAFLVYSLTYKRKRDYTKETIGIILPNEHKIINDLQYKDDD